MRVILLPITSFATWSFYARLNRSGLRIRIRSPRTQNRVRLFSVGRRVVIVAYCNWPRISPAGICNVWTLT